MHRTTHSAAPWRAASAGSGPAISLLRWLLGRVPLPLARALVLGLVWGWFQHFNHPRISVVRAMARLGERRPYWAAWGTFRAYADLLLERHYLFSGRARATLDLGEGRAALDAALASGRPTVLLGSHTGALELAGLLLGPTGRRIVALTARDAGADALHAVVGDPGSRLGEMEDRGGRWVAGRAGDAAGASARGSAGDQGGSGAAGGRRRGAGGPAG